MLHVWPKFREGCGCGLGSQCVGRRAVWVAGTVSAPERGLPGEEQAPPPDGAGSVPGPGAAVRTQTDGHPILTLVRATFPAAWVDGCITWAVQDGPPHRVRGVPTHLKGEARSKGPVSVVESLAPVPQGHPLSPIPTPQGDIPLCSVRARSDAVADCGSMPLHRRREKLLEGPMHRTRDGGRERRLYTAHQGTKAPAYQGTRVPGHQGGRRVLPPQGRPVGGCGIGIGSLIFTRQVQRYGKRPMLDLDSAVSRSTSRRAWPGRTRLQTRCRPPIRGSVPHGRDRMGRGAVGGALSPEPVSCGHER